MTENLRASKINKRVTKELHKFRKSKKKALKEGDDTLKLIDICKIRGDCRNVQIVVQGPKDTPYEGGFFDFRIFMNEDYPINPPKAYLSTPIYHPNINKQGAICLTTLKDKGWSPSTTLKNLGLSLLSLLGDANVKDPLDNETADDFIKHPEEADKKAREWTKKFASEDPRLEVPKEEDEKKEKKDKKEKKEKKDKKKKKKDKKEKKKKKAKKNSKD